MIKVSDKVQKRVDKTMKLMRQLDETNADMIEALFEECKTEQDVIKMLITPMTIYSENQKYPKRGVLDDIIRQEKIIISERFSTPHKAVDANGNGVISQKKRLCLPLIVRANQQVALKEGKSAKDDSTRNLAGQVTGKESRSGALTDMEVNVLIAHGSDAILRELMGPASHDVEGSKAMKREIMRNGSVSLKDLPEDSKNKRGNLYLSHIMRAIGIDTDLIESPLK